MNDAAQCIAESISRMVAAIAITGLAGFTIYALMRITLHCVAEAWRGFRSNASTTNTITFTPRAK